MRVVTVMLVAAWLGGLLLPFGWDYVSAAGNLSVTRTISVSDRDSYVNAEPGKSGNNYGDMSEIWVISYLSGQARNQRVFVHFNLPQISTGSTVTLATLYLYMKDAPSADRTYGAHRVDPNDWTEGTGAKGSGIDWVTYDGSTSWTTPGGDFLGATSTTATGTTSGVWLDWTVTTDVSAFVAGTASNYGWCIKDATEDEGTEYKSDFYSKETSETQKPYLEITFIAPWESYSDSEHSLQEDNFTGSTNHVYMEGTGFATGSYDVGYYDATATGGGDLVVTDENISVTDGTLNSEYLLTTDPLAVGDADWHVLVQPAGATNPLPSNYSTAVTDPDFYELLANDSFYVAQEAIPEFPTVMAGIMVAGLCFGIYYWMRQRRLAYVKA